MYGYLLIIWSVLFLGIVAVIIRLSGKGGFKRRFVQWLISNVIIWIMWIIPVMWLVLSLGRVLSEFWPLLKTPPKNVRPQVALLYFL